MIEAGDVLGTMTRMVSQLAGLAIVWHLVLGFVLLALWRGWRPSRRRAATGMVAPLLSVAAAALIFGNPFNGTVFLALAVLLAVLARSAGEEPVARGRRWSAWAGVALLAFAWVYPHFLEAPAVAYLVAAPLGVIPCPTLIALTGLALVGDGLGARAWSLALASAGLFYGVVGVLWLGVAIDVVLVAGSLVLLVVAHPFPRATRGLPSRT